jgi:CDP-diacylglycerol--glycerol-3-phosphate 3-phosphatidyltransferase/cardiolipin synthase
MAQIGATRSIAVNFLGKLKTAVQMVAIPMLLFNNTIHNFDTALVGYWMIWLAVLLTILSMGYYLRLALPTIIANSK